MVLASNIQSIVKTVLHEPVKAIYRFVDMNDVAGYEPSGSLILCMKAQYHTINWDLVQLLMVENGEVKDLFVYQVCGYTFSVQIIS